MSQKFHLKITSPLGPLFLTANATHLLTLSFTSSEVNTEKENLFSPLIASAANELQEYFAGKRRQFTLPLNPVGTEFQRAVWELTATIPYGQTSTYSTLARDLNLPHAYRAVAQALKHNPLPIFIPCHRVINKDGSLSGYFGGIEIKKRLLKLEQNLK